LKLGGYSFLVYVVVNFRVNYFGNDLLLQARVKFGCELFTGQVGISVAQNLIRNFVLFFWSEAKVVAFNLADGRGPKEDCVNFTITDVALVLRIFMQNPLLTAWYF
jgi:hypothetical protein